MKETVVGYEARFEANKGRDTLCLFDKTLDELMLKVGRAKSGSDLFQYLVSLVALKEIEFDQTDDFIRSLIQNVCLIREYEQEYESIKSDMLPLESKYREAKESITEALGKRAATALFRKEFSDPLDLAGAIESAFNNACEGYMYQDVLSELTFLIKRKNECLNAIKRIKSTFEFHIKNDDNFSQMTSNFKYENSLFIDHKLILSKVGYNELAHYLSSPDNLTANSQRYKTHRGMA